MGRDGAGSGRRRVPYADLGEPDTRGPGRYLWWLVVRQTPRVLLGALWGSTWMVGLMLPPYLISKAIDEGLRPSNMHALTLWSVAILGAGVLSATLGILRHRAMTLLRTETAYRTVQLVIRHATRLGAALPRSVSAGEVVSIGAADAAVIGQTMTITGPGVGAVIAYLAVAVALFHISALLAAVVLLGVPLLAVLVGPLLSRLHRAEGTYREHQGALTACAGDIVAGLRVLCGIGGKSFFADRYRTRSLALRDEGYRVGAVTSWIQALAVGLPGLFLAVVTWLAARMAASGDLTIGQMVAVYGYVAALVVPVSFFIEGGYDLSRGLVAARRVIAVLDLTPQSDVVGGGHAGPACGADFRDPDSGLLVPGGRMLAIASARAGDALAVVDRLGRYAPTATTWGDQALAEMPLAEVRRRILVADHDAHLFAGPVRRVLGDPEEPDDGRLTEVLHQAAASDIVAGLPAGLDSFIEAQARNVSGGQRQRLRLARALLAVPEVLVLVEPTSAVDAHTEATIAARLRQARQGRTTVVVSTSPLMLDRADEVAYLVDGRVVGVGTHAELLAAEPMYRRLVYRGSDPGTSAPSVSSRCSRVEEAAR